MVPAPNKTRLRVVGVGREGLSPLRGIVRRVVIVPVAVGVGVLAEVAGIKRCNLCPCQPGNQLAGFHFMRYSISAPVGVPNPVSM